MSQPFNDSKKPQKIIEIYNRIDELKEKEEKAYAVNDRALWRKLNLERRELTHKVRDYKLNDRLHELSDILKNKVAPNKIEILGIDPVSKSFDVRISAGVTKDDLNGIWDVIKNLNLNNMTARNEENLNQEIVFWKRSMKTYRWIADKYFPNETDREASIDKVKKIYKRNMGTDWRGETQWGDKFID